VTRPILAVDVDGVLNAISGGKPPAGWRDARVLPGSPYSSGFRIRHNPGHGAKLLAIAEETGAELTWCTTWEDLANEHIRQLVGLPELPVVPVSTGQTRSRSTVGEMKSAALRAYAGERPFCWLDDEPDAAHELRDCGTPHLVVEVDPETGLQDMHFAEARAWLLALAENAGEVTR
jgi:hypothetical protein